MANVLDSPRAYGEQLEGPWQPNRECSDQGVKRTGYVVYLFMKELSKPAVHKSLKFGLDAWGTESYVLRQYSVHNNEPQTGIYHLSTCLNISLSSSEKLQFGHYTIHILWHKLSLHTTIWSVIYELWKWAILHVNWHHKLVIKKVLRIWIVQHQKANWCNLYWASHAGNFPRKQAA